MVVFVTSVLIISGDGGIPSLSYPEQRRRGRAGHELRGLRGLHGPAVRRHSAAEHAGVREIERLVRNPLRWVGCLSSNNTASAAVLNAVV
jgi:hypothetical protein